MTQLYKATIKEVRGSHLEKIDEIKGTPEQIAAHIVSKYAKKDSVFTIPAQEFLKSEVQRYV